MNISQLFKNLTFSSIRKNSVIIGIALFVALSGYLAYNYYSTQKELSEYKGNTDLRTLKENKEILENIKKQVLVPENEEPRIGVVKDAFRLRGQAFFARVENGDKVIIYDTDQLAVLYRPSTKKIIEVAQVKISDFDAAQNQLADTNQSTSPNYVLGDSEKRADDSKADEGAEEPARVAVYNGTTITGLAGKLSTYLKKELGDGAITTPKIENANGTYENTIIIDVTGKYSETFSKVKSLLSAEVSEKPSDVELPDVDFVIIAGKNIDVSIIK